MTVGEGTAWQAGREVEGGLIRLMNTWSAIFKRCIVPGQSPFMNVINVLKQTQLPALHQVSILIKNIQCHNTYVSLIPQSNAALLFLRWQMCQFNYSYVTGQNVSGDVKWFHDRNPNLLLSVEWTVGCLSCDEWEWMYKEHMTLGVIYSCPVFVYLNVCLLCLLHLYVLFL